MAAQDLYIKTTQTTSPVNGTDNNATSGWVDAYVTWGLSLSDGARSKLMTPAPHKDPVTNKNVITHGVSIVQSGVYKDARQVSLEVHITAPDSSTFKTRYADFCSKVLDVGFINLKLACAPTVIYHMRYVDCQQFTEFNLEMAKFTLTLEEYNPSVRS